MTIGEINLVIKTYQQQEQDNAKATIAQNYNLAYLTSIFVLNGFNGKSTPTINELFPDMFPTAVDKQAEKDAKALALYKEQLLDYAAAHNKKRNNAKEGEHI